MSSSTPRVSIGIPVYNGENYLVQALDSLLTQTFHDLEVVICDNASTDGTERICRSYMKRDSRVRYHRNATNLGAAPNHNICFELSRGDYFKWNAHDDMCAPQFLEKCVAALDADSGAALVYPRTQYCDGAGRVIARVDPNIAENYTVVRRTDAAEPHIRFRELLPGKHRCYQVFGLMRSSVLRTMMPLQGGYAGGDDVFLIRVGLRGRYVELKDRLLFSRDHPERFIRAESTRRARTVWFDTSKAGRLLFPDWRIFWEVRKSIDTAGLPMKERALCYRELSIWLRDHWGRKLWEDAIAPAKHKLRQSGTLRKAYASVRRSRPVSST